MKKLIAFTFILLFVQQLSAFTFYDQLCNFNFNWKKYEMRAPKGDARIFYSDKELIQAHLACVLEILRSNPVDQLSVQQLSSRLHLMDVLDQYRKAGNFPMNYYVEKRVPVFIDENKTHCAVGYLLQQSGHEDIALRIAAADNYAWVKDIHDPGLPAWQQSSGFTLEELKLIQGSYFSYREDAFVAVDKYEIPQKPVVKTVYFVNEALHRSLASKPENIWIQGEGANGILNGKWIQNYSVGMPWIVGYYENGQRTGQWEEYFQGTKQVCRTENWRNNKLNGIRKRFDKYGNLIEEILFKDGNAIKKTNYSLEDSLVYIRKPVDSANVWTEVYNYDGAMIGCGHEKIYNPGNLLWFQNIELTALNYASISARDMSRANDVNTNSASYSSRKTNLFNQTPLVQYKKENDWMYYKEYNYVALKNPVHSQNIMISAYKHFEQELLNSMSMFDDVKLLSAYDSIGVEYFDNHVLNFYGYGKEYLHCEILYYDWKKTFTLSSFNPEFNVYPYYGFVQNEKPIELEPVIKECGEYDKDGGKIGEWKHFSKTGQLYKTENYLVAWKEED